MKITIITIASLISFYAYVNAQTIDTTSAKKTTINGFCLCKTTLSTLKSSNDDLKEVDVEEMDLAKNCYGQDSRFIAGKGFSTANQIGMVFQKDQQSDDISKIRLTKQFKGSLPDGNYIDMHTFLLKDLLILYPQYKGEWGSRDCSDYWKFSNDTIAFYVKINKTKKPQFPIDETYYMDKPVEAVDIVMSCNITPQNNRKHAPPISSEAVVFIDSIRVSRADISKFDANEVAFVNVYNDTSAIKILGPEAKHGLIYVESKKFARQRIWKYFKSKSEQYAKLVPSPDIYSNIQYILNKKILKDDYEGYLAFINDKLFKGIEIIDKAQLEKDYGITNKEYGIVITTDTSANLSHSH